MKRPVILASALAIFLFMAIPFSASAQPGVKLKKDDIRWISLGGGLRTSFSSVEKAAPDGTDYSKDFNFEDFRLYINAQVHKGITFEFNTQQADGSRQILDAVAKFHLSPLFTIWAGRFIPPSDRALLDGPFFLNTFDFPFVSAYPNISAGRDNGVAFWGLAGKLKYQVGAFQGRQGGANVKDNPLLTARMTYNFWDPEPEIYYNQSVYYGEKDILSIGVVAMYQDNGAGTATVNGDFTGWNVDFLMEKKLGNDGVVNLEFAYYDYNLDDVDDSSFSGFSLTQGQSYFILGSYLFPGKVGWGKFQPHVRYQEFDRDSTNGVGNRGIRSKIEGGINYIIDGHNARLALIAGSERPGPGQERINSVKLGIQLQLF